MILIKVAKNLKPWKNPEVDNLGKNKTRKTKSFRNFEKKLGLQTKITKNHEKKLEF